MRKVFLAVLFVCGMSGAMTFDSLGNLVDIEHDSLYVQLSGPAVLGPIMSCKRSLVVYGKFYGHNDLEFWLFCFKWYEVKKTAILVPNTIKYWYCGGTYPPCDTITSLIACLPDTIRPDTGYEFWCGNGSASVRQSRPFTIPSLPTSIGQSVNITQKQVPARKSCVVRADGRVVSKKDVVIRKGVLIVR